MEKLKGVAIALTLLVGLPAKAIVTMDVDSSVRSGTYRCPSVKECVMLVRGAEERGAEQWCNSATIKRDGRVVWVKNFYPRSTSYYNP